LLSKYKEECPLLYDSVTDFMCIVDSNFVIRGISPSVEQISGHKSEKLTGKRILDKLWKYGNWIGDLVARRKDGSLFEVHLSATLVKDKAGEPVCVMGTFEDISENMKMQNIINQSEKLSSLGQLTAELSHELRTSGGDQFMRPTLSGYYGPVRQA